VNPLLDLEARPVIAHRGFSARAPENTLAAFELAVAAGADAIELDVRVTADDVAVAIHDPALDRTTDLSGHVARLPLAHVREADAGARFSPDGGRTFPWAARGLRVPLLDEVLGALPHHPLLIEIKAPGAQQAVRRVLLRHGAAERCVLASELAAALAAFHGPPFILGASRADITSLWLRAALGLGPGRVGYRALSVPERHRGLPVPTRRFIAAARRLGCPVHVWTVNDAAAAVRLWAKGACGIVTGAPAAIRAARAAAGIP
jgi:glycerophosphoryl diester phosphodiesterase